jgi:hypothetical protein
VTADARRSLDEPRESIIGRRLQRIGYAQDVAAKLALDEDAEALAMLNPNSKSLTAASPTSKT